MFFPYFITFKVNLSSLTCIILLQLFNSGKLFKNKTIKCEPSSSQMIIFISALSIFCRQFDARATSMKGLVQPGKDELKEPTCLPLDCVLSGWGRGWRHLRHITGPLIKTHVRQSDRHGKTVWKKLLGIKYIVTTWFQRFINKLTDHLVSIRSDRSTNPGISALGLVGGGRW